MSNKEHRANKPRKYVSKASGFTKRCGHCGEDFSPPCNATITKYCSPHCRREVKRWKQRASRRAMEASGTMWGLGEVDHYYREKRKMADRRGVEWSLSREQFGLLWGRPCHYCGVDVVRGGIDRVDSGAGYVSGNVVPSCPVCNMMKRTMGCGDFIAHCCRIAANAGRV